MAGMSPNTNVEVGKGNSLAERLNLTVFEINGYSLVTGLYWQTLNDPRSYMAEARAWGKANGMDIVAIRVGDSVTQAGFAPKNRGAYKGMYGYANVIADLLGDNSLSVFELPDGRFALAAVLDGSVVPGSDLVGDRRVVEAKANAIRNLTEGTNKKWERLVGPADWHFADITMELGDVIAPRALKRHQQLRQLTFGLSPKEGLRIALGLVAAATVVFGGLYAWTRHSANATQASVQAQTDAAIAAAKAAAAAADAANKPAGAAAAVVPPWASQPSARAMIDACMPRLHSFPLSIGGWIFDNAHCDASGAVLATYKRTDGYTATQFRNRVADLFHAAPDVADDGESGTIGGQLPLQPAGEEDLPAATTAREALRDHFTAHGLKPTVALVPPPPPPVGQANPPPPPNWTTYSVALDSPWNANSAFDGAPTAGLRLASIAVKLDDTAATLTWTITGTQYAR